MCDSVKDTLEQPFAYSFQNYTMVKEGGVGWGRTGLRIYTYDDRTCLKQFASYKEVKTITSVDILFLFFKQV